MLGFISKYSEPTWQRTKEHQNLAPIKDPQLWHSYAEGLYRVPHGPPLPHPSKTRPISSVFFTSYKDEKAIQCLQHGQSSDHTGLQGEHLIYVLSKIAPILAHRYMEDKRTWITIRHFLHTSNGFIIRPSDMDIHLSYMLHNVIGQL